MATFYATYRAEAESVNTVKLIRNGKVFADVTDVYTMVWNGTTELYEATLDDATFTEDYYRIEDGAANIVVKNFPLKINTTGNVADDFVKNDADDTIIGELTVKPASGTDSQLRIGDETSTTITLSGENAAKSADRIVRIQGGSLDLQNRAGSDIKITGLADGTASGDAVSYDQLDAALGVGWTTENLVDHETRIANLEGSGTFTTPSVSLAATGRGGRGISLNWYMNNSTNEDAVKRYEVYMASSALAGHAAGALSSAQLAALRAHAQRLNLGSILDNSAYVPTFDDNYFIVVAFDHDSPETNVASAEVYGGAGNVLDETTPIVGDATSFAAALTALANEFDKLQTGISSSGYLDLIASQNSPATTAGGTAAGLLEYTNATTSYVKKIIGVFYKDDVFDTIRLRCKLKTDNASYKAYLKVECDSEEYELNTIATSYENSTINLDCSALANGFYEFSVEIKIENAAATATMTDWIIWRVAS